MFPFISVESVTSFLWHSADVAQKVYYQVAELRSWKAKAIQCERWLMICGRSGVKKEKVCHMLVLNTFKYNNDLNQCQ